MLSMLYVLYRLLVAWYQCRIIVPPLSVKWTWVECNPYLYWSVARLLMFWDIDINFLLYRRASVFKTRGPCSPYSPLLILLKCCNAYFLVILHQCKYVLMSTSIFPWWPHTCIYDQLYAAGIEPRYIPGQLESSFPWSGRYPVILARAYSP